MEGVEFNAQAILLQAKSTAIEFYYSLPRAVDKPLKNTSLVQWYPPPRGFFKLNMNGSALGNQGLAGAGGLIRRSDGSWVSGFIRNIGITSSFAAEL